MRGEIVIVDVIIIGSGPFGISLAAHAVAHNLSYKLIGYPMDFWKNQMPQDMFIRTPHDFVSFSDANDEFTIHRYGEETGTELVTPLPRPIFVEYANWFAKKTGIEFTPELAINVSYDGDTYTVVTETNQVLKSKNVIVAIGVQHYKYMPEMFKHLPETLVSHTSGYTDFHQFKGRKVVVIGSGQSAWEAAGLLHLANANVELIYRRESANYGGSYQAEIELREVGDVFFNLPLEQKKEGWGQSPGSVAHFLRPYVEGKVPEMGNIVVESAGQTGDGKVRLRLSNGTTRIVDHVISATGFRINLDRVPFLDKSFRKQIAREEEYEQYPALSETFESSISGLYFAGPLSSHSHGPTFRFILGLKKTASTIIPAIVKKISPVLE